MGKLGLEVGAGESGAGPTPAAKVLEQLPGQTPALSKAGYTIRYFGVKKNEKTAIHAQSVGAEAEEILEKGLKV